MVYRACRKRSVLIGPYDDIDEAQLCTYAPSNIYFGHWLRDALSMELLAEQQGLRPLSFRREPWFHEPGYRELMNLPGDFISFARVKNLWVVNDIGLNAGWVTRFKELRRRVRRKSEPGGPERIFLARGSLGVARELINAPALVDLLEKRGFLHIQPETLQPKDLVRALASAKIVVSVEGSALNHVHYAVPENSGVLVIQPPDRFNAFHKILMDFNRIRFGFVVADRDRGGFSLPADRLLQTLDLM
jgi:capsular polysaccharide biosynthesis protein